MGGGVFPDPELGCGERSDSINPLPGKWSQQLERPWERPALAPDLVPLVTACPGTLPALLLPMQEEVGQPISPPRPPLLSLLSSGVWESEVAAVRSRCLSLLSLMVAMVRRVRHLQGALTRKANRVAVGAAVTHCSSSTCFSPSSSSGGGKR